MEWRDDLSAIEWDRLLAEIGGHPLQSALWGEAKKSIYGISDQRLSIYIKNNLVALIRVEKRGLKLFSKIAWIPQGPTLTSDIQWRDIETMIQDRFKKLSYALCVTSPWKSIFNTEKKGGRQTIWIDLNSEKQKIWSALGYGVRKAAQINAKITTLCSNSEVTDFYHLCLLIGTKKEFNFQYTNAFLQYLLDHGDENGVEAKLFLVKIENKIAAGAFVFRVGKNVHYMWGAVDRTYSKYRLGEFVQWSVIEWACEKNCALYDLEGIDEINNPGVAAFKKKMGGRVVNLQDRQINYFNFKGRILSKLIEKKYVP
ncbi:MAG: GNAT family N-acetyltransferase [Gammaproteobacteria bacterium]|nr:GNAT family N-acetyltransferase [Gammaproteobacteria bacterium]